MGRGGRGEGEGGASLSSAIRPTEREQRGRLRRKRARACVRGICERSAAPFESAVSPPKISEEEELCFWKTRPRRAIWQAPASTQNKPKGKPGHVRGRPFFGARGGGSVGVRNRTGFTTRFVPVGQTPTEPNKAEGPVRFLSWVGQAHQLWEEGVPCPTPLQWSGTGAN